jgi:hypothetical protein
VCLRNLKRGDQGPIWAVAPLEEEEVKLQVVSFWEIYLYTYTRREFLMEGVLYLIPAPYLETTV